MATGWIAWAYLLLAAGGAGPEDVVRLNQRAFEIPIRVQPERRGEIAELLLFCSRDRGKTWELKARVGPEKDRFPFQASEDGEFWFSVGVVTKGSSSAPDPYKTPVGQRIRVDTVKPEVRIASAERHGDKLVVRWEAREDDPDWATLKMEWRAADSPSGPWVPVGVMPRQPVAQAQGLPAGDVVVRLRLKDRSENEGVAEQVVRAAPGSSSVASGTPPSRPMVDPAVVGAGAVEPQPVRTTAAAGPAPTPTPPAGDREGEVKPPPVAPPGTGPAVATPVGTSPAGASEESRHTSPDTPAPTGHASDSAGAPGASLPGRVGALPPLRIINTRQVKLDFEVSKFGPSGLGGVEVYVTTDEGATWEKFAGEAQVSLNPPTGPGPVLGTVTVSLPPKEAVTYGFYLVVKSKAGLGKPAPKSGDTPQVRVEVDTRPPTASLYAPQPDSARHDGLVLIWKAEDRNLAANPITLEWAAQRDGRWELIGEPHLPNTGRYTWQVPDNIPPKVYLRLTVRDTAGNSAVAQTPEPILIDLTVPEITNVGLSAR